MKMVKYIARTLVTLGLFLMLNASASAGVLSTSDSLTITAINGQRTELNNSANLKLGKNLVELKYDGIFPSYTDDTEVRVTSNRLYLPLTIGEEISNYQIETAEITSEEEAKQFTSAPSIYLIDSQGARVEKKLLSPNELLTQLFLTK